MEKGSEVDIMLFWMTLLRQIKSNSHFNFLRKLSKVKPTVIGHTDGHG